MNPFIQLDSALFYFINHLPHNLSLDLFFSFLSLVGNWGILWIFIIAALLVWEEVKDRKGFYALILAILTSIVTSDMILKNIFQRFRPEFLLSNVIVVSDMSKSFSFPSGHTTIAFAAAYILAREHKRWAWGYYLVAFLIAFSRIYLGKHYPGDVLGGIVLGTLIGFMSLKTVNRRYIKGAK